LDEDDRLLMQSGGGGGGGAGGGIGVGNNSLFNETGAASRGCFFFFNVSFSLYIFFLSWLLALFKIYYINIKKVFYLQHA